VHVPGVISDITFVMSHSVNCMHIRAPTGKDVHKPRDPCLRNRDVQNFDGDETLQLSRRWPRPRSSRESREL